MGLRVAQRIFQYCGRFSSTESQHRGTRWDYGYQITGISDRTTIADGNTWYAPTRCLVLPKLLHAS